MATIELPVQKLVWSTIDQHQLKKIFFQFEISQTNGKLKISLVAYPAYIPNWRTVRVEMPVISSERPVTLNLPITFGNIELGSSQIRELNRTGHNEFIFRPDLFTENPHPGYNIFDGAVSLTKADPSPPAQPGII